MKKLSHIIQSMMTNLIDPSDVTNLDLVERHGNFYAYFNYSDGNRYRVSEHLMVEKVEGGMLCSCFEARKMQEMIRGERNTLETTQEDLAKVVRPMVLEATLNDIQEFLIGVGEPDEGESGELRAAVLEYILSDKKSRQEMRELIGLFFGLDAERKFAYAL